MTINKDKCINTLQDEKEENVVNMLMISRLEDLKLATVDLFRSSRRSIQIYSSSLDKRILSNRDIEQAVIKLLRSNRNAKIQCLIFDEKELQGHDHRIVNLAQRFTSFIEIKVIPDEYKGTISGYYLSDKKEMVYRTNREKFDARIFKLPQQEVIDKTKHFDALWQQSRPASFLRALHI